MNVNMQACRKAGRSHCLTLSTWQSLNNFSPGMMLRPWLHPYLQVLTDTYIALARLPHCKPWQGVRSQVISLFTGVGGLDLGLSQLHTQSWMVWL